MSVSGRSSSCSIVQDEGLVKLMCRTPRTPIKNKSQTSLKKSEKKRSLFQSNGSAEIDDLGLIRALSPSSCSSTQSISSPQFSPNGRFSTSPRTRGNRSPKITSAKIEVKSSLFPDLKVFTPRSRRSTRTPGSAGRKVCTPDGEEASDKSSTTPLNKFRRRELFNDSIVSESDSSCGASWNNESNEDISDNNISDCPTILGIRPLSCESFYGPVPKSPKVRTRLFIDTIEPSRRNLERSMSRDSLSSNKSFVSGGTRKKSDNKGSHHGHHSKSSNSHSRKSNGRNKGIQPGVWHNIKRPKQIKKIKSTERPSISPSDRLALHPSSQTNEIKVKEKLLFQENPRKRVVHVRKRNRNEADDDEIFEQLKKKKKLHSSELKIHSAVSSSENVTPDPNKKFLKYGQSRRATFTINQNIKLQISDGVMKLQSPKKRRKLYFGKKDQIEDFNDFDNEGDEGIQNSIQNILNVLENDKGTKKTEPDFSTVLQPRNSPFKNETTTPTRSQRSPLKRVANLPTMIINDFDSDDDDENINPEKINPAKKSNETTLERTGNMVSFMTNILVNKDQDLNISFNNDSYENGAENSPPDGKFYSLFYKQNWNKHSTENESPANAKSHKKNAFVPDDQYLLDAGQESVGIVTCKKCGVMYQAGDFADEAIHNSFHNHLPELKFTGWINERVVGRFEDGRVIMILEADPKIWWQKVSKIVEIVDQELGFPEASVQSLFYKTVYLYINDKSKQIAGCLIAEECKLGYKMLPPIEGVEIDSCSKDPTPCKIGISRIWTSLPYRRKGVASRMIECLQKTFFFGNIVPLEAIAFSVPSPAGKLLAQKVTGRQDFLVYGFD